MDKIVIRDLQVSGAHGADHQLTDFLISAELTLNLKIAGETDRISQTINYIDLCNDIERYFSGLDHKLIESSAEDLVRHILLNYLSVKRVNLEIKMPSKPESHNLSHSGIIIEREWHTAYIGVGSNLGNRHKNILEAETLINKSTLSRVTGISSIYETEPFGYVEQDRFLNCVFKVMTLLTPVQFINSLMGIEFKLKRERIIHWGPRTIDLDILFYDNIITSLEEAVIPHPRMHERMFVLIPLCDLAPYYLHPVLNERCYRIAEKLGSEQKAPSVWTP